MMSDIKPVIVSGPSELVNFSVYRITIGEYVYIGNTRDLYDRANRHANDKRRTIGRLLCELECDMYVEHIDSPTTKEQARALERHHIKLAKEQHGHKLLNVHHANNRKM
jgi:hypothetical protein